LQFIGLDLLSEIPMEPIEFDYRFNDYPVDDDGNPRFTDESDDDDGYIHWLSDYLRSVPDDPSDDQFPLSQELRKLSPEGAMRLLALCVVHNIWRFEAILEDERMAELEQFSANACWPYSFPKPFDFGLRVLMANALRDEHEPPERIRLLRVFVDEFCHEIGK